MRTPLSLSHKRKVVTPPLSTAMQATRRTAGTDQAVGELRDAELSPSETIRKSGRKRHSGCKVAQAEHGDSERGRGKGCRIGASAKRMPKSARRRPVCRWHVGTHRAPRSRSLGDCAAVTVAEQKIAQHGAVGAGPGRSAGRFCDAGLL